MEGGGGRRKQLRASLNGVTLARFGLFLRVQTLASTPGQQGAGAAAEARAAGLWWLEAMTTLGWILGGVADILGLECECFLCVCVLVCVCVCVCLCVYSEPCMWVVWYWDCSVSMKVFLCVFECMHVQVYV